MSPHMKVPRVFVSVILSKLSCVLFHMSAILHVRKALTTCVCCFADSLAVPRQSACALLQ